MRVVDVKVQKEFTVSVNQEEVHLLILSLNYYKKEYVTSGTEVFTLLTDLSRDLNSLLVE